MLNTECAQLIKKKIDLGYHIELGKNPTEYAADFKEAVKTVQASSSPTERAVLSLVEPRISFVRQLELLGINLDPAIFNLPRTSNLKPYAVWLSVVSPGLTVLDAVNGLDSSLRPASPVEAINGDIESILDQSFVTMPGGEYNSSGILTGGKQRFRALCLDRYFGKPRVTQISIRERDGFVSLLTACAA